MVLAERLMFFRISHWSVLTRLLSVKLVGLAVGAFDVVNCSLSVVCGRNIKKICRDQSRFTFLSRALAAGFRARGYAARERACAPT